MRLHRQDSQSKDQLKVAEVGGSDTQSQTEGGCTYDEVFEWDSDTHCSLLAFNFPGKFSDFKGNRMQYQAAKNRFREFATPISSAF